jgi:hypothetical protein
MPSYTISNTAAVAIVGADLFGNEVWSRSPRNRVATSFAMVGSTNAGDTGVDLFIDETRIGTFMNTQGGANLVPQFDDFQSLEALFIPAGAQLRCVVNDAAASNPVITTIRVEDQ